MIPVFPLGAQTGYITFNKALVGAQAHDSNGEGLPPLFPGRAGGSSAHRQEGDTSFAGHIRGMIAYAMTGAVTSVGMTLAGLVAQSLVESLI
jgi:hypothetical protein